ncbi:CvpA family protein [Martelella alba]|uniref:CvpA family protein n=1 Tax=Martelella alba TaxID=2590451 RepID=A0A506UJC0_9HYPH|nr:CvpA family protein [Martelella alba]TPW33415.1 CvpA family protein [Martelella alba]
MFDLIVIGVLLFSALLAMVRGFSREILSIAAWAISAAAGYFLYPMLQPAVSGFLNDPRLAIAAAFAIIFLVVLIIVSFVTTRLADYIIDSRVGALDRSLGFVFGLLRGLLILVVAVAFWNWLVGDAQSPDWVRNAKSKPVLDALASKLEALLPGGSNPATQGQASAKNMLFAATDTYFFAVPQNLIRGV